MLARQASARREKFSSASPWNRSSLLLNCLQFLNIPLELGGPNQILHSWSGVTSTEQAGIVTTLDLMAVLFLVQHSVWFVLFTVKTHFWLVCVLASTITPGPFQQSCQFVPGLYQRLSWSDLSLLNVKGSLTIYSLILAWSYQNEGLLFVCHLLLP